MTDDLIAWLRAQLDEDELVAQASKSAFWYADGHSDEAMAFMDRFDEDRALAEVDAKRRILDLHVPTEDVFYGSPLCKQCDPTAWPCPTVRLLALPYANRPGYREEWRP